jgi:3-hydroxyacyl-CoA dehydrogenase|tara:strand:- start:121 stop:2421 length:2301 start_codon:yes stop_codon:yes gene_type:complete
MIFKRIAVIGAGTMGSGIAGQIANAGQKVLLLDLTKEATEYALERLQKSEPAPLHQRSNIDLIETGTIESDFNKLAECDWIVEAVVERLDIKRNLYKRLDDVINDDCIVTSNTSTIPIKLLVAEMPLAFRQRFAITHYFNPVRYMRLLELVRGADTRTDVIDKLSTYNDKVLGKGVVPCDDTPGFLGNRVGVFALQVGMDEAFKQGLSIEHADALMGRPMGIPKTGVFGLYDMIGVDLMSDVVDTLGDILPENDVFHAVGRSNNPANGLVNSMIVEGFTGQKSGKGGFYREDNAIELFNGRMRPRTTQLPQMAQAAAIAQQEGRETLPLMIEGDGPHTRFCRNFLGRVLAYAAALIPEVTRTPQDIDDAMKMGFNWIRGPFEMIDALGAATVIELAKEAGCEIPLALSISAQHGCFYKADAGTLMVLNFEDPPVLKPVSLPEGTQRFSLTRRTLKPVASNQAASLWELPGDLRLVEFHSKANALTAESMEIVQKAANDHGRGILIHNDAQHFSAGVDLNRFADFIERNAWNEMDSFLNDFQQAVAALKYCPVPVVGAPSGLSLGGGFEVLLHCDRLITHANSVLGLVESGVGVVPGGGGVKTTYQRWLEATQDPEIAAWETWMQIGYGKTGESPEQATKLRYFRPEYDQTVMNRDKLITQATVLLEKMAVNYTPPIRPQMDLPGNAILQKMDDFMADGVAKGWFKPHNKTTAMQIATIVVNTTSDEPLTVTEQDMFNRERAAFLHLAKTSDTKRWIKAMLSGSEIK